MRDTLFVRLLTLVAVVSFVSCQKEVSDDSIFPPPPENPLLGTWKLVDNNIDTRITQELSDDIGTVTNVALLDYVTLNNKGSITFEENRILSKQLSFDVADTLKSEVYVNGFLVESFETPVSGSAPPSSSSSVYVLVGTDSIYCESGSFLRVEGAEGIESKPTGFKFTVQGDRLVLVNHVTESEQTTEEGITSTNEIRVTALTTLQRQ